jgi:sodium/bile acid cotransporter 7
MTESEAMQKGETATANDVEGSATHENTESEEAVESSSTWKKGWNGSCKFYQNNDFIVQVVVAILLARAYPPLGAEYLQPKITSTWIAVVFIFILAGLGLKTEEFRKAFQRLGFNSFIQVFNLGIVSSIVFGISRGLTAVGAIPQSLADGMVVCASLPLTINMCLVLTKSSGGDEASAIFNAAFGNMIGVFLSPILILGYLGVSGNVEVWTIFYKLGLRVVLPVTIGQALQKYSPAVVTFNKKHKQKFKKAQQLCLVFIVYTVFCRTFSKEDDETKVQDIFLMIAILFCILVLVMSLSWISLGLLFPDKPTLRVFGLFGCTHKTVAMGVPLINAIYEKDPLVGLYTLPLIIWHPMQLVLGSFLAPKLYKWVQAEKERLGIQYDEDHEVERVSKKEERQKESAVGTKEEEAKYCEEDKENDEESLENFSGHGSL